MRELVSTLFAGLAALCITTATGWSEAVDPSERSIERSISRGAATSSYISGYRGKKTVSYKGRHRPGTVIISTQKRTLLLVQPGGKAIQYGVGVGRQGFQWNGRTRISRKSKWPGWTPPAAMRKRQPYLPKYMPGGVNNPLGARALYLGSSLYRIHGTNQPQTIGHAVSSGCIRMVNKEVIDLYSRVKVGARVIVTR